MALPTIRIEAHTYSILVKRAKKYDLPVATYLRACLSQWIPAGCPLSSAPPANVVSKPAASPPVRRSGDRIADFAASLIADSDAPDEDDHDSFWKQNGRDLRGCEYEHPTGKWINPRGDYVTPTAEELDALGGVPDDDS